MTFVWLILAIGVFFFLVLVGSGIQEYLSTKNEPKKEDQVS